MATRLPSVKRVSVSTQALAARRARPPGSLPRFLPGGRVGAFRVESCLGSGWEGAVYRVRDPARRACVLKLFRQRAFASRSDLQQRLRHLRRVQASTGSSSVSIQLVHRQDAWQAVLLPYQPGESLHAILARRPSGRLPLREAAKAFQAILRELVRLHGRGAYHGDLHEGNVLLARCGRGQRAHFIDPMPQVGARVALQENDLVEAVRLFSWMLGGAPAYASHPAWVRSIIRGSKARAILAHHPRVTDLLAAVRAGMQGRSASRILGD